MPDNWHRVGAPGGAGPLARAPRPGTPTPSKPMGPGILAWTGLRKAGREHRKAPGASRRSNPSFRGEGKAMSPRRAGRKRRVGPGARTQGPGR